ncbi:hypothetical protein [Maridesulfovibrio frigidus]|uniref:hypothetical protein n=1 Tax=Maridesulfovibrio frigidus TaxID=340956 RepID=UPI0004E0C3BB|nr:hypothetical protein [Maridesulfovibrio frigidus]
MKYICEKNCFVRNPQGVFQRFNVGDEVEYGDGVKVSDHFKREDGGDSSNEDGSDKKGSKSEREELKGKLNKLGVTFSPKDSLPKLRTLLKEACAD